MTEREPHETPEVGARPAPDRASPDWRRLEVTANRLGSRIEQGIEAARSGHREISDTTARCIAHVLGRAYGRESGLALFGRTGEGTNSSLRDEYLTFYNKAKFDATCKEWIDWFGAYLIQREGIGTGRLFMNEHLPPKLDRLLVRTDITIAGQTFVVNVPAHWNSDTQNDLTELLTTLRLPEDDALQAFLALPDVSAGTDDIMEAFHESFVGTFPDTATAVHHLCELDEWETDVETYAGERGLIVEALSVNYPMLLTRLAEIYDIAPVNGHIHVFSK